MEQFRRASRPNPGSAQAQADRETDKIMTAPNAVELDPIDFTGLWRTIEGYARGPRAGTHAYLHASIRRLAVLASDERMSVRTPVRVAAALGYYADVLNPRQVGALRDWLQSQGVATAGEPQ